MYDEKHQFFSIGVGKQEKHRKGIREQLLCDSCENRLSKWEDYAARFFSGRKKIEGKMVQNHLHMKGLDYHKLKLFLLSLLWRFAVAQNAVLSGARLGPHKERIRRMLLANDPGGELDYPCVIVAATFDRKHFPDLIVAPHESRTPDGHRIWQIVVGGFVLMFVVSSHTQTCRLRPTFLKPSGEATMVIMEVRRIGFLAKLFRRIAEMDEPK